MYSRTKQKDLLEHLLSKSKEEFILEYTSYDETTTRDVWVAILAELKNAVIFSNIQRLKALKKLTDYINSTNNVKLGTYYNHSELNYTNLVILACKHNAQKSLQYLFNNCDFLKNIHCTLSPCDEDEVHHNAFYYAIRSNNVQILQKLIDEWPGIISQEIDEVISQAYEELKLKNIDLSNETEALVVDTLINVRFYTDESFDEKNAEITIGDIQERIDLVLENIDFINEYLNAEIDETFLYTAKFIVKNIHILKWYLKSTYDRLPWEEIEFCLVTFINSSTKQEEINLLYKSVLTKENILCYLCNFALILKDVKVFIANANVNNLRRLPSLKRSNIIESIIQNNLSFKALYDNYTEIIDVYSLKRMKYYTDLAMSANSTKKEEQFIIIRALQVIGEFTKNTLESPKLSNSTSEILLQSLRIDTRQIVTDLRNSLSHSNFLYKIIQIESNTDFSFFTNIQKDIKKINTVISEILYKLKIKRLRTLLKVIIDSSCLNEIRNVVEVFGIRNIHKKNLQIKTPENYCEIEELIDKLKGKMVDKISFEIELFNEITSIIQIQKANLKDILQNYGVGLSILHSSSDRIKVYEIEVIKDSAKKILKNLSLQNESNNFKDLATILSKMFDNAYHRMNLDEDFSWELLTFFEKVIHIVDFEMNSIKSVEELRDKLKGIHDNFRSNCAEIDETIITDKQFDEQLTQKFSLLENVLHENSGKLQDKKIQAILEMLLLDIMSILGGSKNSLNENLLYLDNNLPLLTGKNLRDHLAHGNILSDILPVNPATTILSNIAKITKDNISQVRKIGKIIAHDSLKLKKLHDQNLETTIIQKKMFTAIAEGNFEEIKICIQNGGEVKGRTTNLWTSLHFAAKQSNVEIVKFLLDQNLNIGTKDLKEQSALHIAAVYGNKDFIEFFLENKKIFIDDTDINNRTLLHYAAQNGHKEIIELLNKNKASTTIKDTNGFSPLHYAIFNGHTDSAKMLIKREKNVETNQTKDGCTALHIASERGHIEIINFLLEKNANVNAKNLDGDTSLHKAADNGHLEVAKILILKGAGVNIRAENGSTPLNYAVVRNHEKIVELLIKHTADINVIDKIHLYTPLGYAAYFGFKGIVEILLKNKANINIYQITPLHLAASEGHLDVVRLLLNSNAEINRVNTDGFNALHLSASIGNVEVVKFLLKNKCNPNARANNKRTSLHVAVSGGNKEIVKLLLSEGADVNSEDVNGYTALHLCAISGNEDITKILVEVGAKINVRNSFDKTPLQLAISNDFSGIVEILMKAGTNVNCFDDFSSVYAAVISGSKKTVEILLNRNVININAKSEKDYTLLHLAVNNNHIEIAKMLIQKKCNIDPTCTKNQTPLCVAVQINKEMVDLLLANGANINFGGGLPLQLALITHRKNIVKALLGYKELNLNLKDSYDFTFLHYAALYGDKYLTQVLLKKGLIDIDARDTKNNETPLLIATFENHKDIVEVLLANNANVNAISNDGDTSLYAAVKVGGTDVVNLLLSAGASTKIRNKANISPIELAVKIGNLTIVKILLEFTNVNLVGKNNWSLLHIAAQADHLEIAKYLIEKGADVNARDEKSSKPIHIAAINGSKKVLQYLFNTTDSLNDYGAHNKNLLHYAAAGGQLEMVKYLMDKKFDINFPDLFDSTALCFAASARSKEVVEILLKNGANYKSLFNKKSMDNMFEDENIFRLLTITDKLYESVRNNNISNVQSCLNEGAIPNCKNSDKVTPLHQASCKGYEAIVDILLKHEANPNMLGKGGCTPLHYAANFGHVGIVLKLLSHGAIYDIKNDKNKIPFDLAKQQGTIDILKLIDKSFKSVQNGNSKIIDELNKIKDIHIAKAVMNACNNKNKTLIVVAIQNNFPKTKQLKEVFQGNDVAAYITKAKIMKNQEEYQEAINIYKIILEKRRNIFGPNDPVILDIQDELAGLLYNQQNYTKALKLYEEIYDKRQKILGVKNKDTLYTKSQLLITLHRLGKSDEALLLTFKEVLKMQSNLLGPNDNDVLMTESHMAIVLEELGKYDEALVINYKNYEMYKEKIGIYHPSTLGSQNNIATTLIKQGKTDEALKIFKNVYETMKIYLGPTHTDTLGALHNIGGILIVQEKFDEAIKLFETLYNLQKPIFGPWHPVILRTRFTIANILTDQGKFYAAMKIFKVLFEEGKNILGANHPSIVESLTNMKKIKDILKMDGPDGLKRFEYMNCDINKAAANGDVNIIESLLIGGDDVNTTDSEGRTPLHFASSNNHTNIVLLLLQHNADVTRKTNKGNTPLHIASCKGNKEITEILLKHVKQTKNEKLVNFIDAKTNTGGSTALHAAVKGNFEDVVKILIEYGATYDLTDNKNKMPSDLCTGKNLTDLFKLINELFKDAKTGNQSIINKLQVLKRDDYFAIMNTRNKQGNTLLQVAMVNKHKDVVRKLMELLKA